MIICNKADCKKPINETETYVEVAWISQAYKYSLLRYHKNCYSKMLGVEIS